jgi:hypothetical protein
MAAGVAAIELLHGQNQAVACAFRLGSRPHVWFGSKGEAPLPLLNFRLAPASEPSGNVSDVPLNDIPGDT